MQQQTFNQQHPLRVFTAFSGIDFQCQALDRLVKKYPPFCYTLVGWSEIDKYAIQMHDLLYPQYKDGNYGNIQQVEWESMPDFDLPTWSSPCQDWLLAGRQLGGRRLRHSLVAHLVHQGSRKNQAA